MLEDGVGAGDGVERCGDHQLQIALGEDDVGVLPVEHLALFGDAQLAGEAVHGLGEDGAVSGTSAAAYSAAAAVEEAQGDAALARDFVQCAVRLPYLPGGGDHAAVLVGVGVAEHDLLLVIPGFEQGLVGGGGPELAADGRGVAQVLNGLEERDRLQARVGVVGIACAGAAFDADAAEPRQPKHVEHVLRRGCPADDVARERFRHVFAFEGGDGAEGSRSLQRSEG